MVFTLSASKSAHDDVPHWRRPKPTKTQPWVENIIRTLADSATTTFFLVITIIAFYLGCTIILFNLKRCQCVIYRHSVKHTKNKMTNSATWFILQKTPWHSTFQQCRAPQQWPSPIKKVLKVLSINHQVPSTKNQATNVEYQVPRIKSKSTKYQVLSCTTTTLTRPQQKGPASRQRSVTPCTKDLCLSWSFSDPHFPPHSDVQSPCAAQRPLCSAFWPSSDQGQDDNGVKVVGPCCHFAPDGPNDDLRVRT